MYVQRLHCQYYHTMTSMPTSGTLASKHRVYDDLEEDPGSITDLREEVTVMRQQLHWSRTTVKHLSILLRQRNEEIEALLQEMQFGTAAIAGGTAWGATIPAFWGRRAINADDGKFTQDSNISQEAVATSIVRLANEQRTISSSNADSQSGSCEIAQDCTWPDALIDINEASPGDTASHMEVGFDIPAAIKFSESMAEDDFSGVQFHEAFWAVPEWRVPKSGPEQKATPHPSLAYLQGPHSLSSLAAGPAVRQADSAGNDDNASDSDIPQHKASSMDGVDQQSVTASQVRALQDLVLSMQQLLGHAAKERAAMQQQLRDAKASAEQLQILQQVNEAELAMWRTGIHVGSMPSQEQGLEHVLSSQLQQTQAVLHQALAHQEEFMVQVMNLLPIGEAPMADDDDDAPVAPGTVVEDTQAQGSGLERDADKPNATATPLVTEQPEASEEEDEQASPDSPVLTADGKDKSAAEPQQQLKHAHAVIAVLAARLGELERCNALLQDQLARSMDDLIKSGPQEPWLADGFPWDDRAPADDGEKQVSKLVSATTLDSRDGVFQPDEPAAAGAAHEYLPELREHEAIAAAAQGEHLQTPGQTAESSPEADSKRAAVDTDARAAADTENHRPVEALPMPHSLASCGKEASADGAELSDLAQRVQAHSAADDAQMASRLAAALVAARLVETLPSQHVPASSDKDTSSEEDSLSKKPPTDRAHSDAEDGQLASRLAAAEEQNALLAATHAELERWLMHAQHQLTDYAAAHTDELLSPARKLFHGASFALTKAVAEVKSTGGLATPELQPLMVSEPARVSASSQACIAWHDGYVQSSADKAGTMAELAASRTKLACVAAQLAESERCRESLQQQLLDMGEAKMHTLAAANSPEQATAADSSMHDEATDAEAQEWQPADTQLFSEDAQAPRCPACGRGQGEMINEAGSGTLEASISEVAALQVAMAQSEAIFLDLEAQLRAGFEREQASQGRIAALEQQLQTAVAQGRIAAPRGKAQQGTATPQHAALDVPGPAPASPEGQVESSQDACEQAAGAAAECQSGQEGSTQPLQQQPEVQAIMVQLRAAQSRASNAEGIIGRLQDQVFDQQALIAELQSSLTAAQAKSPPADQAAQQMDEASGALPSKAMGAQQLLTTPHEPAASLAVVKFIEKGSLLGPAHVDISPLLVACTLIAGQSESPEELYNIILRESSTFAPQLKGAHQTGLPATQAATADTEGNGMERTASTQSSSDNMRENPLFLRGSLDGSEQSTQGSGSEDEAHHRTMRGREAQQMVQRLKDSRSGRSMRPERAVDAKKRSAASRAPYGRRSSRQGQHQAAKPWSLPSLRRALAEERSSFSTCGSSMSSLLGGALNVEDEDEVLDTIYANWGEAFEGTGEQDDGKLAALPLERCASLEEALRSATRQLESAKAAEALLQSENSILRAENVTLAARLAELKRATQGHAPAQPTLGHGSPSPGAARTAMAPQGACMAPGHGIHGQPCSQYAWELQDLHMRMAAAIAQIRALEADKAAVARQLASGCNLPALPAPPAQDSGMSSQSAEWGSASCHCDGMQEMAQTIAQLQAQLLLSQSSCQAVDMEIRQLRQASHASHPC